MSATDSNATSGPGPSTSRKVLFTGATGSIGAHLVDALQARCASFAVMCRRAEQRHAFRGRGIEAVAGDFSDPTSIRSAARGLDQLFLLAPGGLDQFGQDQVAIDAAVAAGVRHVLKVSTLDANPGSAIPWALDHARADAYLAATGLRWTRLAPWAFTKNLLVLAPAIQRGVLPGTSGHGATSWVDVHDIGQAAARVLTEPALQADEAGRSYSLTGTHPLSFPEIATVIGDQLKTRFATCTCPARSCMRVCGSCVCPLVGQRFGAPVHRCGAPWGRSGPRPHL